MPDGTAVLGAEALSTRVGFWGKLLGSAVELVSQPPRHHHLHTGLFAGWLALALAGGHLVAQGGEPARVRTVGLVNLPTTAPATHTATPRNVHDSAQHCSYPLPAPTASLHRTTVATPFH